MMMMMLVDCLKGGKLREVHVSVRLIIIAQRPRNVTKGMLLALDGVEWRDSSHKLMRNKLICNDSRGYPLSASGG